MQENHWQLCQRYINSEQVVEIYGGRKVRITGISVPGSAFCEAVDGGTPIYHVSTAFLL